MRNRHIFVDACSPPFGELVVGVCIVTTPEDPESKKMMDLAASGDRSASFDLLHQHRDRLRKMVAVRMDPRLAARVDPSDVVQDAMWEASQKLPAYLKDRPMPLYPWLRQIAWERLMHLNQKHLHAQLRSVAREQRHEPALSDDSMIRMADQFATSATSPSGRMKAVEAGLLVRAALDQLPGSDREVLVLRYLEQLSTSEIAVVTGISETGVKSRQRRAVERLRQLLGNEFQDQPK
jgi:RNA polymerase sigma-70 factor (ECF subfamily)